MISIRTILPLLLITVAAAGTHAEEEQPSALMVKARMLTQRNMLIDTHIDVPERLQSHWEDVTQLTNDGDFDYERARRGGLNVPFMSIYTPAESEAAGTSHELANLLIDRVEALAGRAPKKMAVVKSSQQAAKAREIGLMALAMGMENGAPLDGNLANVEFFKERGVSYITLTHSLSNHICDSSYDENRPWGGLSPFGREVVAEMNRLGVMIDVSHVSDQTFWQVMELSQAPVIASHSSARYFTPGWERNMSDEMIQALAAKGGVIMINFGSSFLTQPAREWFDAMVAARKAFLAANGLDEHDGAAEQFQLDYRAEHPFPYANVDDLVANFMHVIELVGVEYVGIGSDFDGVGDSLPVGMKSVEDYPNLVEKLLEKGLSEEDIALILGGNLLRVWGAVEEYAAQAEQAAAAG